MNKKPTLTNSKNSVHMAIFEQTKEDGTTWFSTTLKRPYCTKGGKWEHGSYSLKQLEALIELAQQAIRYIDESQRASETADKPVAA